MAFTVVLIIWLAIKNSESSKKYFYLELRYQKFMSFIWPQSRNQKKKQSKLSHYDEVDNFVDQKHHEFTSVVGQYFLMRI